MEMAEREGERDREMSERNSGAEEGAGSREKEEV